MDGLTDLQVDGPTNLAMSSLGSLVDLALHLKIKMEEYFTEPSIACHEFEENVTGISY